MMIADTIDAEPLWSPDLMKHAYSQEGSKEFWRRVNALPDPDRGEVYAAGVLLQNMEETVLTWLHSGEARARGDKKR